MYGQELKIILVSDIFEYDLNWPKLNLTAAGFLFQIYRAIYEMLANKVRPFSVLDRFSFDAKREVLRGKGENNLKTKQWFVLENLCKARLIEFRPLCLVIKSNHEKPASL